MSYLLPALGDISPSEARVQAMATFIVTRRKQGQSDDTIRRYLSLPGPLPLSHPCAGGGGQQLCADWEISQAFGNASLLSALAPATGGAGEKPGGWGSLAGLLSLRNALMAGAILAGFWVLERNRK